MCASWRYASLTGTARRPSFSCPGFANHYAHHRANPKTIHDKFLVGYQGWYVNPRVYEEYLLNEHRIGLHAQEMVHLSLLVRSNVRRLAISPLIFASPGHHGWIHWFDKPIPDGGKPTIDAWPDVSEYSPEELYPAPGLSIDGKPALLFSSRNPKTVQR